MVRFVEKCSDSSPLAVCGRPLSGCAAIVRSSLETVAFGPAGRASSTPNQDGANVTSVLKCVNIRMNVPKEERAQNPEFYARWSGQNPTLETRPGTSAAPEECDSRDEPAPVLGLFGAQLSFRFACETDGFAWPLRNPLKSLRFDLIHFAVFFLFKGLRERGGRGAPRRLRRPAASRRGGGIGFLG